MVHRVLRSLAEDVWDVVRAASPTHLSLRTRLVKAFVLTVIVDVIAGVCIYFAERHAPTTGVHNFGDALFWTTAQMTTLSSSLTNPLTGVGKAISVLIDIYAITVVSTLAGIFSAFFYRRGEEGEQRGDRD
ncbi:hypothetical protein ABZ820_19900 [Streptomyces diacarni]|uniref:hypothetical protein n=1 Tax=Streptomyces diacarni TaxID=2800381 RepID=UPI0011C0658A